jgi:hypothetical protein
MRILKVKRATLRNEEWFGFYADFKKLVEKFGPAILLIVELFDLFLPLFEKADRLLLVLRKSLHTEDMQTAGKKRMTIFRSLVKIISGMINQPDATKKESARRLNNLMKQYKQYGVKGGYEEESSGIYNLLQDLNGTYAADITLLGLGEWVVALQAAETQFQTARAERIQETIEKPKESLKIVRKEIDQLYVGMTNIIESKLMADGLGGDVVVEPGDLATGPYEDGTPDEQKGNVFYNFVTAWNVIAKYYQTILTTRATLLNKKKEEQEPSEPSGPVED